jgi:YesN/AraC family two-component response regulator
LFKKHTSKTYNDYLNCLRIEKAKEMLIESSISIKEAASKSGYLNLNNFYAQFKHHTGITPKAFITSSIGAKDY